LTEEAEGQGAGSRGSNPRPGAVKRSGTWVSSPALPGRSRLVGVQAPSNPPPRSPPPAPLPLLTAFLKCYCLSAQIEKIRIICFWLYVVGM
jgi:hypothetical protein